MHMQVTSEGPELAVALVGRLDLAGVQAIDTEFTRKVTSSTRPVALDCAQLAFIASLGIGMIVAAAKGLRRKGLALRLLNPQPLVEETLRSAGIHNILPIVHASGG
jgi:anti-sigma B factor antagonist